MPPLASLQRRRLPTAGRGTGAAAGAPQRSSGARCAPRASGARFASPPTPGHPPPLPVARATSPRLSSSRVATSGGVYSAHSLRPPGRPPIARDARNRAPEMPPLTMRACAPDEFPSQVLTPRAGARAAAAAAAAADAAATGTHTAFVSAAAAATLRGGCGWPIRPRRARRVAAATPDAAGIAQHMRRPPRVARAPPAPLVR